MFDSGVELEELYYDDYYETTTAYFLIEKSVLDELHPGKYPEAEHGCISIEYPTGLIDIDYAQVCISPTKDGSDYDWTDLDLPHEDIEKLLRLIDLKEKVNV